MYEKIQLDLVHQLLYQLFKDDGFNLKEIRNNKIVKPVKIDLLPNEIKKLKIQKKKRTYLFK